MVDSQKVSNEDNHLSKKKLAAISFFLVLGSVVWSILGFSIGLGYGLSGQKPDLIFWLLSWPYFITFFADEIIWSPLSKLLGDLKYELDFVVPFLGSALLLILASLIALIIKKFWGSKYVFVYSIIFGVLPIIAYGLFYTYSYTIASKQQAEQQVQFQKEIEEIKSTLPIKEPTYIPSFLTKIGERPGSNPDGVTFYYSGGGTKNITQSCLTITQYEGPLGVKFPNTLISSEKFIDINGTKALLRSEKDISGNTYPGELRFEHSGFSFMFMYLRGGSCSKLPLLSEDELLKIVRSMVK